MLSSMTSQLFCLRFHLWCFKSQPFERLHLWWLGGKSQSDDESEHLPPKFYYLIVTYHQERHTSSQTSNVYMEVLIIHFLRFHQAHKWYIMLYRLIHNKRKIILSDKEAVSRDKGAAYFSRVLLASLSANIRKVILLYFLKTTLPPHLLLFNFLLCGVWCIYIRYYR